MTLLYLAAHGYGDERLSLGGGATVCTQLLREWGRTKPFAVQLISPAILDGDAPSGQDLAGYGERRYATQA